MVKKKTRKGGGGPPSSQVVSVKLPGAVVSKIDALLAERQKVTSFISLNRSDVVRELIFKALEVLK